MNNRDSLNMENSPKKSRLKILKKLLLPAFILLLNICAIVIFILLMQLITYAFEVQIKVGNKSYESSSIIGIIIFLCVIFLFLFNLYLSIKKNKIKKFLIDSWISAIIITPIFYHILPVSILNLTNNYQLAIVSAGIIGIVIIILLLSSILYQSIILISEFLHTKNIIKKNREELVEILARHLILIITITLSFFILPSIVFDITNNYQLSILSAKIIGIMIIMSTLGTIFIYLFNNNKNCAEGFLIKDLIFLLVEFLFYGTIAFVFSFEIIKNIIDCGTECVLDFSLITNHPSLF